MNYRLNKKLNRARLYLKILRGAEQTLLNSKQHFIRVITINGDSIFNLPKLQERITFVKKDIKKTIDSFRNI